jgi:hypothetical protein
MKQAWWKFCGFCEKVCVCVCDQKGKKAESIAALARALVLLVARQLLLLELP